MRTCSKLGSPILTFANRAEIASPTGPIIASGTMIRRIAVHF
jgi:hypothetical protein